MLTNLLDNALKYGGPEPRVDVHVRVRDRGRIVTRIMDNGAGVPSELRRKIFRIFFRGGNELERRHKGTGLGLYISKNIVEAHRGKIAGFNNGNGGGATFVITLPISRDEKMLLS